MSSLKNKALGLVLGLSVAGSGLAVAAPAGASVRLGGVDMDGACQRQYPIRPLVRSVVADTRNAYSWYCKSGGWNGVKVGGIDVNRACVSQYGWRAYSGLADPRNAFSWYCAR